MKKYTSILLISLFMMLMACSENSTGFTVVEEEHSDPIAEKPSLEVTVKTTGNQANVYVTTDLSISKDNYGKEKEDGEGHIHIYLDNGEKVGVTEVPVTFNDLPTGPHKVRVSLHNNDHTPYDVTETVEFHIQ
jgi:hypothetical protein